MAENLWTAGDIIKATGGNLIDGDFNATGFAMDSREVKTGDIFIALIPETGGEKYRTSGQDGHNFIPMAINNGAVAAIISREMDNITIPQILVEDTTKAMNDLAVYARNRATLKHGIGITGSVGKTGTRDMFEHVFATTSMPTHASIKSYNNDIGVPYTLACMHKNTQVLISEMGMNRAGEISKSTAIVRPTMAVITWISEQHIENFSDGIDGIVKAKSEIFEGVEENGLAILPRDNDFYDDLKNNFLNRHSDRAARVKESPAIETRSLDYARDDGVYSFGADEHADAKLLSCRLTNEGTVIQADIMGDIVNYTMPILGRHNAMNSLSALLVIKLAGENVQDAAIALSKIKGVEGRGRLEKINDITLIDDSYNAAPAAMIAAFDVLKDIQTRGRKIAILGYMGELGDYSRDMHESLADPLLAAGIDKVYCCGADMKYLYDLIPAPQQGGYFENAQQIADDIKTILNPSDVVLIKGANGANLKIVIQAMQSMHK